MKRELRLLASPIERVIREGRAPRIHPANGATISHGIAEDRDEKPEDGQLLMGDVRQLRELLQ